MATFVAPEAKGVIGPVQTQPQFLAEHLARVFGTEEDPVNCSFFFKVGACRNGDRCGKKHNHPSSSQTLLLTGLYPGTPEGIDIANEMPWNDDMYDRAQAHVEAFYEEVVLVLAEYGEIEEVFVVDNTIDYMLGNVYVRYRHENCAGKALVGLTGRYYFGKLISAEYSPVADFREARCRAHHETRCTRVGACRFLHIKHIPKAIKRRVARQMYKEHPEFLRGGREHVSAADRAVARMNLEDRPDRPNKNPGGGPRALRDAGDYGKGNGRNDEPRGRKPTGAEADIYNPEAVFLEEDEPEYDENGERRPLMRRKRAPGQDQGRRVNGRYEDYGRGYDEVEEESEPDSEEL